MKLHRNTEKKTKKKNLKILILFIMSYLCNQFLNKSMTFNELGLRSQVVKAVTDMGFEQPTPIQQEAIPHLLKSKSDFVGLAQTGTGKTAAFGLPLVNRITESRKYPTGLRSEEHTSELQSRPHLVCRLLLEKKKKKKK